MAALLVTLVQVKSMKYQCFRTFLLLLGAPFRLNVLGAVTGMVVGEDTGRALGGYVVVRDERSQAELERDELCRGKTFM